MYRIRLNHSDPEHPNGAYFFWGPVFSSEGEAKTAFDACREQYPAAEYALAVVVLNDQTGEWDTTGLEG